MSNSRRSTFDLVPCLLLGGAIAFNVVAYSSELTIDVPEINDHVLHLGAISRANDVWQAGGNPRDPWIPYWSEGFPLLRYYQHLSHLGVVVLFRLLRGTVPLHDVFTVVRFLLLVLAPASFYAGVRMLGFERLAAGLVAACVPVLAVAPDEGFLTGLQPSSYLWAGHGLFPQLVGMVLFAPAIGAVHGAVVRQRQFGFALVLLAAVCLSHLLLGYMAITLSALVILRPEVAGRRLEVLLNLAGLYAATLVVASYVIVPSVTESYLLHRTVWESQEYWHSYGLQQVLNWLVRGSLLDGPRAPVLTLLTGAGLIVVLVGYGRAVAAPGARRFAAVGFVVSLALYFGRPTWGRLLDLLPFSDVLPMHRWICAVQYGAVLLAGLALAVMWQAIRWNVSRTRLAVAVCATVVVLGPAFSSQWQASRRAAAMRKQAERDYQSGGRGLNELLLEVHQRDLEQPGRAYAGRGWDWGKDYKLGYVPVYMLWPEYDISAIAYMFMMSLNTDVEAEFDPQRKDHHDLFNVRHLFHYDQASLPPFARVYATRPGIYAATVETPGYFSLVGADLFYRFGKNGSRALLELNRAFVRSQLHATRRFVRIGVGDRASPRPGEREISGPADIEQLGSDPWRAPDGAVHDIWGHNDRFGARVETREPAYVLFRMTFHPNWRAFVDDKPVETVMLSPSFIGIPVDPGEHRIEVRYVPSAWTSVLFYLGLAVLGGGVLGDRLDIWAGARGRRRCAYKRVLLETMVALIVFAVVRAAVNAPIPEARMPHSAAAHARKLSAWDPGQG